MMDRRSFLARLTAPLVAAYEQAAADLD